MKIFVGDYCLRESCSNCTFKGIHRVSDFTLGDYWGVWDQLPEMDDNKGTSLVFVRGNKAQELFNLLNENFDYKEVDRGESTTMNPSMIRSSVSKENRNEFLKEINSNNFEEITNKYLITQNTEKRSFGNSVKAKIKRILNKV